MTDLNDVVKMELGREFLKSLVQAMQMSIFTLHSAETGGKFHSKNDLEKARLNLENSITLFYRAANDQPLRTAIDHLVDARERNAKGRRSYD